MSYDNAVTYDSAGNMEVSTYDMGDYTIGQDHQGQNLYVMDGVEMTDAQADENAHYFQDEGDDYGTGYEDDDQYAPETLPEDILQTITTINSVFDDDYDVGSFIADELLGLGDSVMDDVVRATGMSHGQIQEAANAVCIDLAHAVGFDSDMLMAEMGKDIAKVRSMGSPRATAEMRAVIAEAVDGDYDTAMWRWNNLRGAMKMAR